MNARRPIYVILQLWVPRLVRTHTQHKRNKELRFLMRMTLGVLQQAYNSEKKNVQKLFSLKLDALTNDKSKTAQIKICDKVGIVFPSSKTIRPITICASPN